MPGTQQGSVFLPVSGFVDLTEIGGIAAGLANNDLGAGEEMS